MDDGKFARSCRGGCGEAQEVETGRVFLSVNRLLYCTLQYGKYLDTTAAGTVELEYGALGQGLLKREGDVMDGGVGREGEEGGLYGRCGDAAGLGTGDVVESLGFAPFAPDNGVVGRVHVVAALAETDVVPALLQGHGGGGVGDGVGGFGEGVGLEEKVVVVVGIEGQLVERRVARVPRDARVARIVRTYDGYPRRGTQV